MIDQSSHFYSCFLSSNWIVHHHDRGLTKFHARSEQPWYVSSSTTLGLPDAFCKNTGYFDFSAVPDLSCVVFRKRHMENREAVSIAKPQLLISPCFGWLSHFRVCVTCQSHQGLRQQQQINFVERTVLTRFTTRVNTIWEILR